MSDHKAAYHSYHMRPLASPYLEKLENAGLDVERSDTSCSMFSSVTGQEINSNDVFPPYWVKNMTSPARFSHALARCIADQPEATAIVEVGPHPTLKGPAQEVMKSCGMSKLNYIATCNRGENDFESMLSCAGAMIAAGLPLRSKNVNAKEVNDGLNYRHEPGSVLTDLPSYKWNHNASFWVESRLSRNVRFRKFPRHKLLGSRYVDDIPDCPCWRNHLSLKEVPWLQKIKAQGALELPPAVYILMCLEASRQLSTSNGAVGGALVLSDVQFQNILSLSAFVEADTTIETQLVAKKYDEATSSFDFEIYSALPASEYGWSKLCAGRLGWSNTPTHSTGQCKRNIVHDKALLDMAQIVNPNPFHSLKDVTLNGRGCRGSFDRRPNQDENYAADPVILDAIMAVPSVSLLRHMLPATFRVSSLTSLNVRTQHQELAGGSFAADIESTGLSGSKCDIEMIQENSIIVIEGLRYQAKKLKPQKPAESSLFFQPVLLPDITKNISPPSMDVFHLARLVAHKWPMCDIIVDVMPEEITSNILQAFGLQKPENRHYFRSMCCVGTHIEIPECVRSVNSLDETSTSHVVFSQDVRSIETLLSKLRTHGMLCFPKGLQIIDLDTRFEYVSTVTGLGSEPWSLWRKLSSSKSEPQDRTCVLYSTMPVAQHCAMLPKSNHIQLNVVSLAEFCSQDKIGRFDAIIMDTSYQSVITTWAGKDFMPWMQTLLKWADSILWVTKDRINPFANVVGTLLRTLQSEKPSLKVRWLVLDTVDDRDSASPNEQILRAYCDMLGGENELLARGCHLEQEIIRYYPDDELSQATGLVPPRKTNSPLDHAKYFIDFAAPSEPVTLSSRVSKDPPATIIVQVEASVINVEDVQLPIGLETNLYSQQTCGTFFVGRVLDKSNEITNNGERVVGWNPQQEYTNNVGYRPNYLLSCDEVCTPEGAACTYAAYATACCIVDGKARARQGETFVSELEGSLNDALRMVCEHFHVDIIESSSVQQVDFLVKVDDVRGICVNGESIRLRRYMSSKHGMSTIRCIWNNRRSMLKPISAFPITDLRAAFKNPKPPLSSVLLHEDASKVLEHVPIYREPVQLFSADIYYIIIGGLGGLGRYICSWMVAKGAKYIATISRGGLDRAEAKAAVDALEASGAMIRIFKADACDRTATSDILAALRAERPIKGIINLAMMLGDGPMESMTGEEWDRAMRVKIDSSWIIHEETLQDSLEFFILFSSIASVLGNRNQGNYNVANTFLNALAEYRQSLSLPGISIALGAMTDMGVLHDLSKPDMHQILTRSGLTQLTQFHLGKIMEAAIHESPRRDRSLIVTGLETFEREPDGSLAGRAEPLYWAGLPEFGHLQTYKVPHASTSGDKHVSLKDQIALNVSGGIEKVRPLVTEAFVAFLSRSLGFGVDAFDTTRGLAMYGLDSLSGVACQYWFHNEVGVDVSVGTILGGASIAEIVEGACKKLLARD